MRKTTNNFLLFLLVLIFSNCKDVVNSSFECFEEGEYFGIKHLSEKSDSFWSYQDGQTRVYFNSAGDEFAFDEYIYEPYQEGVTEYPLEYLCSPSNSAPEYNYIDIEYKKVHYHSPKTSALLSIELDVHPVFSGDSIYYIDLLTLKTRSYDTFVIDYQNTFDQNDSHDQFDFTTDTILLGKTFQNVYYQQEELFSVFYTKEQGVVAFYDINENFYVLDKVE
jgi:hypothetical protein